MECQGPDRNCTENMASADYRYLDPLNSSVILCMLELTCTQNSLPGPKRPSVQTKLVKQSPGIRNLKTLQYDCPHALCSDAYLVVINYGRSRTDSVIAKHQKNEHKSRCVKVKSCAASGCL